MPSVTQICRFLSYDQKSTRPWLAEAAARRGTAIHEAALLIDYGAEPEETAEGAGAGRRYKGDSPEQIACCLTCRLSDCNNCLQYHKKGRVPQTKGLRPPRQTAKQTCQTCPTRPLCQSRGWRCGAKTEE